MDGAVGRLNLRGMGLLHRSRQRRERDAEAEVARRLGEARRAELAVQQARGALEAQRADWRRRERESLLAMHETAVRQALLTAHWVEMDRLADEAVQLQSGCETAEMDRGGAEETLGHARAALRRASRLAQRSEAVIGRVHNRRRRAEEAAEAIEAEDDAIRRHASRCGG